MQYTLYPLILWFGIKSLTGTRQSLRNVLFHTTYWLLKAKFYLTGFPRHKNGCVTACMVLTIWWVRDNLGLKLHQTKQHLRARVVFHKQKWHSKVTLLGFDARPNCSKHLSCARLHLISSLWLLSFTDKNLIPACRPIFTHQWVRGCYRHCLLWVHRKL